MRTPFEHAEEATRTFYSKVFFHVLLNYNAVRLGVYHTLLADMEGPFEVGMWKAAIPEVMEKLKRIRREDDGAAEEH